ncbi:SUMF1/EgtB/PvdO family nonheme iron enzyme, partial [Planctomycetota bacterium]
TRQRELHLVGVARDGLLSWVALDGARAQPEDGRFDISWSLEEGRNQAVFEAVDGVGNRTALTLAATLDTTAPTLELSTPIEVGSGTAAGDAQRLLTKEPVLRVQGVARDERLSWVALDDVRGEVSDGRFGFSWALKEGVNDAVVSAADQAGNQVSLALGAVLDTVPPKVRLEAPLGIESEGAKTVTKSLLTNRPELPVRGVVEEKHLAEVLMDGASVQVEANRLAVALSLKEGLNDVSLKVVDKVGNHASFRILATLDTVPPKLQLQAPAEVVGETANLTIRADEPLKSAEVNGEPHELSDGWGTITVPLKPPGHVFVVRAFDLAGNAAEDQVEIRCSYSGWAGEGMPSRMTRGEEEGKYVWRTADGLEVVMVYVAPGDFKMGSDEGDRDEYPPHTHPMSEGYYIGSHEVTVAQFRLFAEKTGYVTLAEKQGSAFAFDGTSWDDTKGLSWRKPGFEQTDDHPVVCVTWDDARAFCEWAGLALPSEPQWERAARGLEGSRYPWGRASLRSTKVFANVADESAKGKYAKVKIIAGYDDGHPFTAPVGSFPTGVAKCGAHDMTGNVQEWCADWYDANSYIRYGRGELAPPKSGVYRVVRGGGWSSSAESLKASGRNATAPAGRLTNLGFRVAKASE